jgi:hypothetical protein
MGFSTGRWEGPTLVVTTTHIKQGWLRRNGTPESDQTTLVERFTKHDKYLAHVAIITDPVYLAEPLIRTTDFVLATEDIGSWLWPCVYVEEISGRPKGEVPHYLPGENPFLLEMVHRTGAPAAAARGGPRTIYPEYEGALKGGGAAIDATEAPRVSQARNPTRAASRSARSNAPLAGGERSCKGRLALVVDTKSAARLPRCSPRSGRSRRPTHHSATCSTRAPTPTTWAATRTSLGRLGHLPAGR